MNEFADICCVIYGELLSDEILTRYLLLKSLTKRFMYITMLHSQYVPGSYMWIS
jgi:hypothetical protein